MNIDSSCYERALKRNLAELTNAILKRRALIGMHQADSTHGLDFFRIAEHALYNDILAHAMRVFDRHKDSGGFWYIKKVNEGAMATALTARGVNKDRLETVVSALVHIRNKTHFHIDKGELLDPKMVWLVANLAGDEFEYALRSAFDVLSDLYQKQTGELIDLPEYDGTDIRDLLREREGRRRFTPFEPEREESAFHG